MSNHRPKSGQKYSGGRNKNNHRSNRNNRNHRGNNNRNRNNSRKGKHGQYINPDRFVKQADPDAVQIDYSPEHSFADFNFNPKLLKNLSYRGFVKPSKIQDKSIPFIMLGRDIVGIADTGTGKTAAFLLPIIHSILEDKSNKSIIVAPTRELAVQIRDELMAFSAGTKLYSTLLVGGKRFDKQERDLRRGVSIVVGTPGRIVDHINRGTLKLQEYNITVLDEVDRMLDMGFIKDITTIFNNVSQEDRQSLFFSATITPKIGDLIDRFSTNAERIMAKEAETSNYVEQSVRRYDDKEHKHNIIKELLNDDETTMSIVFTETKFGAEKLAKFLNKNHIMSASIHGNKSQNQRQRALSRFKDGDVQALVATDVAARGIDVTGVSHVINFDIPHTYDDYTHRIGRTGRNGVHGAAVTMVPKDY